MVTMFADIIHHRITYNKTTQLQTSTDIIPVVLRIMIFHLHIWEGALSGVIIKE